VSILSESPRAAKSAQILFRDGFIVHTGTNAHLKYES
jgi:hypothetical protein